ncbi:MAG: Glu-tRNA(Gln) amidotransferase subunit GatE [Nitrososphaeria archaeon]
MDYKQVGFKAGLEIHQQLDVGKKLFCDCPPLETDIVHSKIMRRLRPTQSELGQMDPAVLYEFRKGKKNVYLYNKDGACLVECDEEPPHPINLDAAKAAITIALALDSNIVQEMHVMRKIVIDGSNTTGFQRTVLVALGGSLKVDELIVPVQTVSLEEDAARIIEDSNDSRIYSLDRLGIPLVEIALTPMSVEPKMVERVALELGRLLRLTKLVARGIGSIRQDLNISVHNLLPSEVKGVQKLDLIPKIVEYEAFRQDYLYQIAQSLKERGLTSSSSIGLYVDVSKMFQNTYSQIVKKSLDSGKNVYGIKLIGFKGLLGAEPFPNVRLGLELAEMARANGLGGILHSDELPSYDITLEEIEQVKKMLGTEVQDGFFLIFASKKDEAALSAVRQRALIFFDGPPPETRGPLPEGRTKYSRPRPGAARMYPETDIPLIQVTEQLLKECSRGVPKPWNEIIKDYINRYGINEKLAVQLLDSNYLSLFEKTCARTKLSPTYVVVTLTESIVSLSREGFDTSFLDEQRCAELFDLIDSGVVSKESSLDIMRHMCKNKVDAKTSAEKIGLRSISENELKNIISETVNSNLNLIEEQKDRSFGALMGEVMRRVRGKVDGRVVSAILKEEIRKVVESKQ